MPKIVEYSAGEGKLQEYSTGTAAWNQAARRIGTFYNQIAETDRAQGRIQEQTLKDTLWPLNIAKLEADLQKEQGGPFKGVRIRAITGLGGFGGDTETFNALDVSDTQIQDLRSHRSASRGAGALGSVLSDGGYAASRTGSGTEETAGSDGRDYKTDANGDIIYSYHDPKGDIYAPGYGLSGEAIQKYNGDLGQASKDYQQRLTEWSQAGYLVYSTGGNTPGQMQTPAAPADTSQNYAPDVAEQLSTERFGM